MADEHKEETVVIKIRFPKYLHEWIKKSAKKERRSLAQQITFFCISDPTPQNPPRRTRRCLWIEFECEGLKYTAKNRLEMNMEENMKEYWTDTILEKLVPAGTDVERGEPVRIYKADETVELLKRVIDYIEHDADCSVGKPMLVSGGIVGEFGCDCGADNLVAELEQIAGK